MCARMRWALVLVACSATGCYRAHERPETPVDTNADGWSSDAAPDAPLVIDAARWDGGPCRSYEMTWGTACTSEIEAECQRRATEEAYGRYGHTHCVTLDNGHQSACSLGDYCEGVPSGSLCRCTATRECAGDIEVCVSDTPDGAHYCAYVCTR